MTGSMGKISLPVNPMAACSSAARAQVSATAQSKPPQNRPPGIKLDFNMMDQSAITPAPAQSIFPPDPAKGGGA